MNFGSSPRSSMREDPLPLLVEALRSGDAATRVQAARDLGRLGPLAHEALEALRAATQDPEGRVREAAAQAIGGMGVIALPHLAELLRHPDKYVRRQAVWALGRLGAQARPLLPELCAALQDSDPRTASGAAQALGNMGAAAAEAVPALAQTMCGTNIVLCRLAAKALSQIGRPALPTLVHHLYHHDPFVRGEAALAIGWMGSAARAAVPHLLAVLREGLEAEYGRGDPGKFETRQTPVRRSGEPDAEAPTPPRVPAASPAAEQEHTPQQNSLIYAVLSLGRLGQAAETAVPLLQRALREGFPALQQAARQALQHILAATSEADDEA